jgi:hypothetical protein
VNDFDQVVTVVDDTVAEGGWVRMGEHGCLQLPWVGLVLKTILKFVSSLDRWQ